MSTSRLMARAAGLTATIGLAGLLTGGTAAAHVTANVYGEPAQQGGYTAIVLRVPNEDDQLRTTKLSVSIAEEYALGSVRTKPVPGWQAKVTTTKLDKPVTNASGAELDEVVTKITWTAQAGHEIAGAEYQEFPISAGPLPTDVDELVLPATQHYEKGKVVKWDEPPSAGDDAEKPAPVVQLAAADADSHGGGSASADDHAAPATVDTTARWLGGIGLAVGALGLGVGAGATIRARKPAKSERA